MNAFIDAVIKKHISASVEVTSFSPVSGGCINSAYHVFTSEDSYFLKCNNSELLPMFEAEEQGLVLLYKDSPIHTPHTLGKGEMDNKSYLLTEWIEKGTPSVQFWENFGVNLASQHRNTSNEFGLAIDNFIGSLPQSNLHHDQWSDFFIKERLIPQLKLASSKNLIPIQIEKQFEKLFKKLSELIPREKPALLHGDLWSGNFMINHKGEASIFDPAVHFGHRETELAFTHLFGGFSPDFYSHYQQAFPMEPGFEERIDIHNLYPLLVHVNLFGTSYLSGIMQTLNRHC